MSKYKILMGKRYCSITWYFNVQP